MIPTHELPGISTGENTSTQKIAFVCLRGSAKSLIAAEYFNRIASERILPPRAITSGPEPDSEVPGNVVAGLKSHGIDVGQYRPALTAAEHLSDANLIVSFGCGAGRRLAPYGRYENNPALRPHTAS